MDPIVFFKSIADETRLKSVLLIDQKQELCVCELMNALELSQPKISRHLAQLKKSGLLTDRRQGQWVFYRLNPDLPAWCQNVLRETSEMNRGYLEKASLLLQQMNVRPDRFNNLC
ncbi:metalloregulator ArsR/SmtB family transcription factor [Amphritea japonica]|uniref:ArsR family transcriptional regulator n=1 Tax=Amphritea japonica ATCC BAA-1530 TaxID=1278309 RepID=A0A7R6PD07_9GAMM|nr:metalloregulator ArsR/SmtB family transcription factor [Amphritea japonica]BBB25841.1 ArsR family transcriptional regulator [Amphritea japonica ATCC BAA-1530]